MTRAGKTYEKERIHMAGTEKAKKENGRPGTGFRAGEAARFDNPDDREIYDTGDASDFAGEKSNSAGENGGRDARKLQDRTVSAAERPRKR